MFMSESCRLNLAIGWVWFWGGGSAGECTKIRHAQGKMATAVTFYEMADLDPISRSRTLVRERTGTLLRLTLAPASPNAAAEQPPFPPGARLKMRTEREGRKEGRKSTCSEFSRALDWEPRLAGSLFAGFVSCRKVPKVLLVRWNKSAPPPERKKQNKLLQKKNFGRRADLNANSQWTFEDAGVRPCGKSTACIEVKSKVTATGQSMWPVCGVRPGKKNSCPHVHFLL